MSYSLWYYLDGSISDVKSEHSVTVESDIWFRTSTDNWIHSVDIMIDGDTYTENFGHTSNDIDIHADIIKCISHIKKQFIPNLIRNALPYRKGVARKILSSKRVRKLVRRGDKINWSCVYNCFLWYIELPNKQLYSI